MNRSKMTKQETKTTSTAIVLPKIPTEYLNNTKLANFIAANDDLLDVNIELKTLPKQNIFIAVNLSADQNVSLSSSNISAFDMAVMDSVYTLQANGSPTFSAEMIARVMTGNFTGKITPQRIGAITRSMAKLAVIRITIDCTNEMRARKLIGKDKTSKLTSYLMPTEEIEITAGNHRSGHGYHLLQVPVLYTYAESVKQVISVPTALLETNTSLSDTEDTIALKRGLIKRIELIKNPKNHMTSDCIKYERFDAKTGTEKGFFASLGIYQDNSKPAAAWRKKKAALHSAICLILDQYTTDHYIQGYEVVRQGKQQIIGVQIKVTGARMSK